MRKILLIAHFDTYFSTFLDLAVDLKYSQGLSVLILFPRFYPNLDRDIKICNQKFIPYKILPNLVSNDMQVNILKKPYSVLKRIIRVVFCSLPGIPYATYLVFYAFKMKQIDGFLKELSPGVIVLGGDIVGHDMALYIKAARRLNIRSILLPSWMVSALEPAESYLYDPKYSLRRIFNKFFCRLYPRWKFHHKGRDLIRLPAQHAMALESLDLAPPMPWVLHSGYADLIAVESEAAMEYGVREGLDSGRMVIVGSYAHDVLHFCLIDRAARKRRLCERYNLDPNKPIVICALPPNMLYGKGGRPECEFSEYKSLVEGFLAPIGCNLESSFVVSLHPSASAVALQFIKEFGAIIAEDSIAELIPLADVYIASISATIQWAIASGIPVVNYDVYRYRYTDYMGLKEVINVETQSAYRDALATIFNVKSELLKHHYEQSAIARHWGVLDGCAAQRITSAIINA